MTWEGYNYEDAVLLNEKLVRNDVYTSVHIEEYEIECRDTKLGPEEITKDIPGVGEDALKDLDENGIIRIGAEVRSGDILVGKATPRARLSLPPRKDFCALYSARRQESKGQLPPCASRRVGNNHRCKGVHGLITATSFLPE